MDQRCVKCGNDSFYICGSDNVDDFTVLDLMCTACETKLSVRINEGDRLTAPDLPRQA
jgi:hypothetical protein